MRMETHPAFYYAADAVFAEALQAPTKIADLSMDEDTYRRKGVAALIAIKGDIEGRVILDLAPDVAMRVASHSPAKPCPRASKSSAKPFANSPIWSSATASRFSTTKGSLQSFFRRKFTSASKASAAAPTRSHGPLHRNPLRRNLT